MNRFFIAALFLVSCTHADKNLTAPEHRELAEEHRVKAETERARFDPSQTNSRVVTRTPFGDGPDGLASAYNPTADHLAAADREMREAAKHTKMAAKLEEKEAVVCAQISEAERSSCPLLASQVALVENYDKGVLLTLKKSADGEKVNNSLNCHLAYARASGFDAPSCPLFVKGMTISMKKPGVIDLQGESPEVTQQLQAQARRIFFGKEVSTQPVSAR